MKALKDDDVHMIGLYGMGGCGKTTLAIDAGRRAEKEEIFDEVVLVTVSRNVEVHRIQEQIASGLVSNLQEKEEMQRAQRLHMRLTQEDKILVILDDVWHWLDFVAIGIPSSKNPKGCKVLITARSEEVLTQMDCHTRISLPLLTEEEAWHLFQIRADISEATSSNIKPLARQISNECGGLPVAITPLACTLKGKQGEEEWKVALDKLKRLKQVKIAKGSENPYPCLRLSYDNLDNEEAKSLFLFCSVFPGGYEIPVEFLTRFAIGLGLVGEIYSYEGVRNEVSAAKSTLISSWLLLDASEEKCVKMHSFVRKVAHWIAKDEGKKIKCVLKKDVTMKYTSPIYLWCEEFPYQLNYSNLEFLCINTYQEISDEIFEGMEKLRVLFLVNKDLERRPLLAKSFKSLSNLRCLLLEHWELGDFSYLGDLKKLESLTLRKCSFFELPDVVVTHLTNLRLLDLLECDMKRSPFEVIGRHPQLEELYMDECKPKLDLLYGESYAELFIKFSVPQTLQRYQIQIGIGSLSEGYQEQLVKCCRTLVLSCFDTSNVAIKDLAKKTEVLCLANIQGGAKNIIPDIFRTDDLCSLTVLELYKCPKLTSLFPPVVARSLAQLEILKILYCAGLKHIVADENREEINTDDQRLVFPKLKQLTARGCSKLEYIIPVTFTQGLLQLECLEIEACAELKNILGQCRDSTGGLEELPQIIEDDDHQSYLNLRLESNQLEGFPEIPSITSAPLGDHNSGPINLCNLKRLILRSCSMLRTLFSPSTAIHLISLEELMIVKCHGLKYLVTCDRAHENQEEIIQENHDLQSYNSIFPRLQRISVMNCNLLEYIFHVSFAGGLVELKDIEIRQTPQLTYVFGKNMHDDDVYCSPQYQNKIQIELPVLEKVAFFGIPNMINICPDNYNTTCSSLRWIFMDDVGLSTMPVNNLMLDSESTRWTHSSTWDVSLPHSN